MTARALTARPARFFLGAGSTALALALGGAPLALSATAHAAASNAKGNLTVHEADTGVEVNANDPKVCTFRLVADGYAGATSISYWFNSWPGGTVALLPGTITVDASGSGQTGVLQLPAGQY
jgi:hypothetical protein